MRSRYTTLTTRPSPRRSPPTSCSSTTSRRDGVRSASSSAWRFRTDLFRARMRVTASRLSLRDSVGAETPEGHADVVAAMKRSWNRALASIAAARTRRGSPAHVASCSPRCRRSVPGRVERQLNRPALHALRSAAGRRGTRATPGRPRARSRDISSSFFEHPELIERVARRSLQPRVLGGREPRARDFVGVVVPCRELNVDSDVAGGRNAHASRAPE